MFHKTGRVLFSDIILFTFNPSDAPDQDASPYTLLVHLPSASFIRYARCHVAFSLAVIRRRESETPSLSCNDILRHIMCAPRTSRGGAELPLLRL